MTDVQVSGGRSPAPLLSVAQQLPKNLICPYSPHTLFFQETGLLRNVATLPCETFAVCRQLSEEKHLPLTSAVLVLHLGWGKGHISPLL